jgi:replicative DNA helicase
MNKDYEKNILKQCFKDKKVFLECIDEIQSEELFEDDLNMLYWQVYYELYKANIDLSQSSVHDILDATGNTELIQSFDEVISSEYQDELEWRYHLSFLQEEYRKRMLVQMSRELDRGVGKLSSDELLQIANNYMGDLNSSSVKATGFREAYKETLENIKSISQGKVKNLLVTGWQRFDEVASLIGKRIVLVAAQKKIGKTRFSIDLIDRIVNNNPGDVAVQWFSFEMQRDEMVRLFISKKSRLTDNQLLSVNYNLSDEQINKIEAGYNYFASYPIEFIDETSNIFSICSKFERFAEANKGRIPICVIDNLGLIKPHMKNDLQSEDDISRMLKDLRDKTGGLIIPLHHLSKESEGKFNSTEMYRPKVTHIRGSSRIVDYANQVILLHRPEHYPDVVKHYRKEGKFELIDKLFTVDVALNRSGSMDLIDFKHELQYSNFKEI